MITNQNIKFNVFDFDGTIITANSFKEVNKLFLFYLLFQFKLFIFFYIVILYFKRKMNLISHFTFKTSISECFEKYLCEMTKQKIIQKVYIENLNTEVFAIMKNSKHLIVSSAAPYCYLSKLNFNVNVELLITSLHPSSQFPDKKNYQVGKLENIFKSIGKNIVIENFYTDNLKEDWPLAEYAKNTFLVNKNKIVKVTKEFIKTFDKSTPNLSK